MVMPQKDSWVPNKHAHRDTHTHAHQLVYSYLQVIVSGVGLSSEFAAGGSVALSLYVCRWRHAHRSEWRSHNTVIA